MPEPMETPSDKIIDQMVTIARDMKSGNQVQGLWKCFNIMVSFIKGQANLIKAMDGKVKQLDRRVKELENEVNALSVIKNRFTPLGGPVQ